MKADIMRKPVPAHELEALGVGVMYLFGSQAEGVAGSGSDIDVGIIFDNPKTATGDTVEIYNRLYALLSDVFDMENFRDLDIVFLDRAPLELRFDVISHGTVLFETSRDFRLDFEERTALLYRDFRPLLKEIDRAVLERV
jgi:predicted nucleotidyltransferase